MQFNWNYFRIQNLKKQVAQGKLPLWVNAYLKHYENQMLQQDIGKARFVVFDTETTGLDLKKDQIISIGAVALQGMKIDIQDSLEIYLQSESTGNKDSVKIHQILRKEVKEGFSTSEALQVFFEYTQADILVAHFAEFDTKMVNKLLKNEYQFSLLNPSIDTIRLAKRIDGFATWDETVKSADYTLDALCQKYNIHISIRHNAVGDALATAELLQILLHKAYRRGIRTLKELLG